jgi:hypothetical protein
MHLDRAEQVITFYILLIRIRKFFFLNPLVQVHNNTHSRGYLMNGKDEGPTGAPVSQAPLPLRSASVWEVYLPRRSPRAHGTVYVASFPPILFFWPTVIVCIIAAISQATSGRDSVVAGWIFLGMLMLNFIVLAHDFDQKQFIILILVLVVLGLIAWIVSLYGFPFLRNAVNWILGFRPVLSTDAYLLLGGILLIMFIFGLISPRFSYWKLEQNEFIHYMQPAGRDRSIARAQCSVYKEIPDIFEYLLFFGGGTLTIRRNDQVLATIPRIPFLSFRMPVIEHLLGETRVVVETDGN